MKLSISGEAHNHHGSKGGTYFLQEDMINDKPYWVHQSGGKAIWWNIKYDMWMIGNFEDLNKNLGSIKSPPNNARPPNQITNDWRYWNGTNWLNITNGVNFEDWTFKPSKVLNML